MAFQEVIGSTDVGMEYNLIDDDSSTSTSTSENDELNDMGSEEEVDFIGQLDDPDVDQVKVAGVTATTPNGVDAVHLSKIWRISAEDAKCQKDIGGHQPTWSMCPGLNTVTKLWNQ